MPSVFIKFRPACPRPSGPHASGSKLHIKHQLQVNQTFFTGVQTTPDEITELLRNSLKGMLDELNVFLGELYSNIDKEMLPLDIEYLGNNWFR